MKSSFTIYGPRALTSTLTSGTLKTHEYRNAVLQMSLSALSGSLDVTVRDGLGATIATMTVTASGDYRLFVEQLGPETVVVLNPSDAVNGATFDERVTLECTRW
jgi:uncharacterized protein YfaP (DUF2135 family)